MKREIFKVSFAIICLFGLFSCSTDDVVNNKEDLNKIKENNESNVDDDILDVDALDDEHILDMVNYLGNKENIHPKVLYFPEKWRGYNYWMAYTPYPLGNINAENPCISVSNDGYNWFTPEGLVNPIDECPENGYNSDTHLVYREDTDELECWYRGYDLATNYDTLLRRVSKDGVHWGEEEVILPFEAAGMRMSPATIYEEGRYICYYSTGKKIMRMESEGNDITKWSDAVEVPFETNGIALWHHDMIVCPDGSHEFIICGYVMDGKHNNNTADLYYAKYYPETNTTSELKMILERNPNIESFYNRSIYRASIIRLNGFVRIYFSAIDNKYHRSMSITEGPSPFELLGWRGSPLGVKIIYDK